jgi:hypothetical protein
LFVAGRNFLGKLTLPNSSGDLSSISIKTISSILNCKTTCQHSPLSGALLHSKDFTRHFHGKPPDLIGNSFEIYFEHDIRTNRWAVRCKNECAVFAHVAAAAFSLAGLPVPIRPPKRDCRLE